MERFYMPTKIFEGRGCIFDNADPDHSVDV